MEDKYFIVILSILLLAMAAVGIYGLWQRKQQKIYRQIKTKNPRKSRNYLYPFYYLFIKVPPLRKSYEKIKNRLKVIYPNELMELNYRVTKDMLKSLLLSGLLLFAFLVTAQKDIYYICLGVALTYIVYTNTINEKYELTDLKLLQQTYNFLTDVHHNYYIAEKKVDDAVYMTIDESPYEMSLHATKIYKILRSIDLDKEVDRYVSIAPNRFILSFVAIATSVMKYSDKVLEDGRSMFLTNIGYLKKEVHSELDKIKKAKSLFFLRTTVTVLPIFLIKPIQAWANKYVPEVSDYYTGVYGIVLEVSIFILAIICYSLVMNLKDRGKKEIKDHFVLRFISKLPIISAILTKETNRNYSKSERVNDKLKLTGEHMGYKQFLLKRILCAAAVFLAFQIIMVTSIWQEKNHILTDFSDAFNSSTFATEEYEEQMKEAAILFLNEEAVWNENIDVEELQQEIMNDTTIKRPVLAQMVAETVVEKINLYNNVYYRWWYLLISLGVMVMGYQFPMFMLNYQIKNIKEGMEDEVVQFQTIVMMLMHVDNISIKIILEWIERFSYCFKESINTCINELPHDEEKALKKLRDSETFAPFKRFINNFLCINKQGVIAAFDEIVQEHENALEDRKTDNEIFLVKKANKATLISIIPLVFEGVFYLLVPLMSLADNMSSLMENVMV